jgi:hypothetical protein
MATKVAIQYGILGGPLRGAKFNRALRAAGYQTVKHSSDADIIIAQSAGCFWLPDPKTNQPLLLINPPYWPDVSVKARVQARSKSNLAFRAFGYPFSHWLWRNILGVLYALRLAHNRRAVQDAQTFDLETAIKGHRAIIVRNESDDWLTPDVDNLKADNPGLQVMHLPGDHDDCWYNPEPYVTLLNKLKS